MFFCLKCFYFFKGYFESWGCEKGRCWTNCDSGTGPGSGWCYTDKDCSLSESQNNNPLNIAESDFPKCDPNEECGEEEICHSTNEEWKSGSNQDYF